MHVTLDLVSVLGKLAKDRAARDLIQNQVPDPHGSLFEVPGRPCPLHSASRISGERC